MKPEHAHLQTGDTVQNSVELIRITDRAWMHVTHEETAAGLMGRNGLVLIADEGAVLCGMPWNGDQLDSLLALVESSFGIPVRSAVLTQALTASDGALERLGQRNIPVHALRVVADQARSLRLTAPDVVLEPDDEGAAKLNLNGMDLELYWPGPAQTADNTVLWAKDGAILYAGAIVKDLETTQLGPMRVQALRQWQDSLKLLESRYAGTECLIPGYGSWGTADLFTHTFELATGLL